MTGCRLDQLPIEDESVYDQLSSILGDTQGFGEKSTQLLQLGESVLSVDDAYIARIDPTTDYWETIGETGEKDGKFPIGQVYDLEETYCGTTVKQGSTIALHDAPEQGWAHEPAFLRHGYHTYLGTPFAVNGRTYGTLCFVSKQPHPRPFSGAEEAFVEFLATVVAQILEKQRQAEIIEEKEEVISTLSRVLRHNLSNDLNVIHGHAEILTEQAEGELQTHIEQIRDKSEELMGLARKARKLQNLVKNEFSRETIALDSVIETVKSTVQDEFPHARFTIETPPRAEVNVLPPFELALYELIHNAAKHTGATPEITIEGRIDKRTFAIRIQDNGPGLPTDEQEVLKTGSRSPLVHGSGLGLWIVYWIVERHDGSVDVTVCEEGTAVEVAIPNATAKIPDEVEVATP